jgi:hypothetical protein
MLLRSVGRGGASAGALPQVRDETVVQLPLWLVVMSAGMGSLASLGMTNRAERASLGMTDFPG